MVGPNHFIMPGAAMPMIVAREIDNSAPCHIKSDIEIIGQLIQEMTGIGSFVSTAPIVGAAHISPRPNPLNRPTVPLTVSIQPDRNDRRLAACCSGNYDQPERQAYNPLSSLHFSIRYPV